MSGLEASREFCERKHGVVSEHRVIGKFFKRALREIKSMKQLTTRVSVVDFGDLCTDRF